MDFTLTETQQAVIEAATNILEKHQPARRAAAPPRAEGPRWSPGGGAASELASAGATGEGHRRQEGPEASGTTLWQELGQAGLLGLAVPESLGGGGLGVPELAVLLTELGRHAAAVPALASLMTGALPLARWAGDPLRSHYLTGAAAGEVLFTAAVREPAAPMPARPATTADGRRTVSGVKIGVPYAAAADWILVPATLSEGGTGIVLVAPSQDGVTLERTPSASGAPEYTVRLGEAAIGSLLGGTDGRAVSDLYQLTLAGACCLADGALAGALELTTGYVAARHQFGRPLATFQAVAQHIAGVSITSRTMHLAALSGAWRLGTGRDAGADLDVAAYWLASQAPAALRTCHHLHGGTGMDISYPLHRYSAMVKDLVRLVGGADYRLGVLGARVCGDEGARCSST